MRIVLLVPPDGARSGVAERIRAHLSDESARALIIPADGPLAESLAWAVRIPRDGGTVLLDPLAAEALDESSLHAIAAETGRLSIVDAEATLDRRIEAALQSFDEGHYDAAREQLVRCESMLGSERTARRAEVLHRLAALAKGAGELDEAARLLDQALAAFPAHVGAIRDRIEVARMAGDVALAAAMRRKLLPHASTDEERVRLLAHVADDALAAAVDAMKAALALKPKHRALLGRLRAVHEACGDFPQAVDTAVALAEATTDRFERARAFVAAADLCAQRAKNVGRAVALYEAAIADDPSVPGAFEAIEGVLLESADFSGAAKAYERQLERLASTSDATDSDRRRDAERALLQKLADVRGDRLDDFEGAAKALDRLVALDPDDMEARSKLATLLEKNGQDALATRCLEIAAGKAPTRAATYHALRRIAVRTKSVDRAFCACAALVSLGEADVEEQRIYSHFAPRVALTPKRPLDDAAWQKLQPEDHDRTLSAIVAAIAPAAVSMKIDELRARNQLPRLDPKAKQNLEQSTVTAVRTVGWAAKLLGVRVPEIYARADEVAHGIALVPALEPTVAIGKALLSGRSVPELTFRITWELAYERITARLLQLHPSLPELSKVIVAAIGIVLKTNTDEETTALASALAAKLDRAQKKALEDAVGRLTARGGTIDLLGWVRSVERTACRAGLLACGDVTVAARILAVDPRAAGGLAAADRIRDLLAFSVSASHASLRETLGIAASGTLPSPTESEELDVVVDVGS